MELLRRGLRELGCGALVSRSSVERLQPRPRRPGPFLSRDNVILQRLFLSKAPRSLDVGMADPGSPIRGQPSRQPEARAAAESTPLLRDGDPSASRPRVDPDQQQSLLWRPGREARHALEATLRCSHTNVLLFCVPLGLLAGGWGWPPAVVFALNFLAMLPLASILTFSTEQLAAVFGSVIGGLINATFGNAVEMIVGPPPPCRQAPSVVPPLSVIF